MISRALYRVAFDPEWGRQMRFICGPRQAGKTTLARQALTDAGSEALYYLWDLRSVRERYRQNELFFTADCPAPRPEVWVCHDEIHKFPKWKNVLKAIFDQTHDRYRFIVTGSAKLNLVKRAGDSLAGRYFTFHLFPLMVCELGASVSSLLEPPDEAKAFLERRMESRAAADDALDGLLMYGGFPEPFVKQSRVFQAKWNAAYVDTVLREDIGNLTRIVDRERIRDLYALLPNMIGAPISEASCAAHIQTSPVTAKNYFRRLEDFYLGFTVPPFSRNIKRALLKARKFYLFDWTGAADPGRRFEAFLACQLKALLSLWSDASGVAFGLHYIRNKQKQESDFLVTRQQNPWLLIEAKVSDGPIEGHHLHTATALGGIPVIQVCREPGVAVRQTRDAYRLSAGRFLA